MMAAGALVLPLLVLAIAAIFRPKAPLIAENLCLRQQLIVLQRRHSKASTSRGVQSERIQRVCHNERLTGCQNGENTTV
jgi:hypothetical protein